MNGLPVTVHRDGTSYENWTTYLLKSAQGDIARVWDKESADYLVRAANAFPALVAACQSVFACMEDVPEWSAVMGVAQYEAVQAALEAAGVGPG